MINSTMRVKRIIKLSVIFIILFGLFQYFRPLPPINPTITLSSPISNVINELILPSYGQSALYAQNYGMLVTKGHQQPVPMASIAKVITTLAILEKKPLSKDQTGPKLTITKNDMAIYNSYQAKDGSLLKIVEGESLNEYEALQAILLPSANNIADTMAIWAFGSIENYVTYANKMIASMGLADTKVADASGFSNASVSTAVDLIKLGQAALSNPIVSEIVSQSSAVLPIAGTVYNYNFLLGSDGVIGIKTGNTDHAGGCYLFAVKRLFNGNNVTIIGAVMGGPDLRTVLLDSRTLIQSFETSLNHISLAKKGQTVSYYQMPWGSKSEVIASNDFYILAWKNGKVKIFPELSSIKSSGKAGQSTGKIVAQLDNQKVEINTELKNNFTNPPLIWRLLRH